MDILTDLNPEQRSAVQSEDSPIIIIAGPGTGKTKTLISSIVYLISHKKVDPSEILAMTFTLKAATEMKERLQQYVPNLKQYPMISTFHALAYDVLSSKSPINIVTPKDQAEIVSTLGKKYPELDIPIRELLLLISRVKDNSIENSSDTVSQKLVAEYDAILKERGMCDFDDLLVGLNTLLQNDDPQIHEIKKKFSHIFIDEFQDTNDIQYHIIKSLLGNTNLFVIGDPLQSIYAFRGADSSIFTKLKSDFPNHEQIILQTNYRSSPEILKVNACIFPDSMPLKPSVTDKGAVKLIQTFDGRTEARWIANEIGALMGGIDLIQAGNTVEQSAEQICFADFAVIYRTHHIGRQIEQEFIESGIPYQMIGRNSPYEQLVIQFIISVMKYIIEPSDQTLQTVTDARPHFISPKVIPLLTENQLFNQKMNVMEVIDEIVTLSGLDEYFNKKPHKLKNLNQFKSALMRFASKKESLKQSVAYLDYLKDHEFYDQNSDRVTLLTMHAAKGLEFSHVFIAGFEEGIIPMKKDDIDLEEEKRLLYVAMTRAKRNLYLLHTQERLGKKSSISSFWELFDTKLLEKIADEAIARTERKRKKRRDKKSQMELF